MTVPLGAIAPPRPRRRSRDLELAVVGTVSLLTCAIVAALQTRWINGWDAGASTGAASLVLLVPAFGLWVFGLLLAIVGWRRRPFRGFWTTDLPVDHLRRALLFASLVLVVVGAVAMVRLAAEIVSAVGRSLT